MISVKTLSNKATLKLPEMRKEKTVKTVTAKEGGSNSGSVLSGAAKGTRSQADGAKRLHHQAIS